MKRQRTSVALATAIALTVTGLLSVVPAAARAADKSVTTEASRPEVTLYVMPQCGYCEKTRQLLTDRGISWKERDITGSAEAKREFDAKGGVGTPLVVIGDEVIRGFDAQRIGAALSAHGLATN